MIRWRRSNPMPRIPEAGTFFKDMLIGLGFVAVVGGYMVAVLVFR